MGDISTKDGGGVKKIHSHFKNPLASPGQGGLPTGARGPQALPDSIPCDTARPAVVSESKGRFGLRPCRVPATALKNTPLALMTRTRWQPALLYLLFFFSGSAGLGYQIVWSKMFATGLGHEMPAVLAVVSAFMGGMALGAWSLDGVLARSRWPGRWYGWLEILIGLCGLLSAVLIPLANQAALRLIGLEPSPLRHWLIAFVLPCLALLPATAAMGATLPAMERFVAPLTLTGRCVGALYAANTVGAVVGILASIYALVPGLGFRRSAWLLAVVNIACGAVALLAGARLSMNRAAMGQASRLPPGRLVRELVSREAPQQTAETALPLSRVRLSVTVFFAGLLGIAFEAVAVRVLSQVLENTVYSFGAVLSVFLLGTSIGAALFQRFGARLNPAFVVGDLLCATGSTCLLGLFALWRAQRIYDACRETFGDATLAVLAAEMAVAAAVLFLPTIFMGATFSCLVQAARRADGGVGRAAALNTFGGALASAVFGVFLLPLVGSKWTLVVISCGYLALTPRFSGWRWGFLVGAVALVGAMPARLRIVQVPPGGRLVEYREGVMASVAVIEHAPGDRTLRVNNRFQMGGTVPAPLEYRQAHVPLLLHPAPKRALFLGLGTGITLGGASRHTGLQSDGVELVPEVVEAMPQFAPYNFSPERQPQLRMFVADARRFVRATAAQYDVIVADLFHPARDGAGSLYTLEHFSAIRRRLAPGGLFCQWLPLHQLDEHMLRVIIRTFLEVFPDGQAWLLHFNVDIPVLGLVGRTRPAHYSARWVEERLTDSQLAQELKKLALADSIRLFGNLLAGPKRLREFAGNAPLNTDDQPRVTFGAPRFVYQKHGSLPGRLLALLKLGVSNPEETLGLDSGPETQRLADRLKKYMTARDVYLRGLVAEAEGRQTKAIDLCVESARLSEDFTSGYAQCLTYASLLARTKPEEARALLQRLVEAQPARPVAKEMLDRLFRK
jgi:spermidine synthase